MDGANFLPNDLAECQRLLLAAFKQATELERRRLASEQRATELKRVLDETAVSYRDLRQEHAATLEELAWYKRWAYGRRRERLQEDQGQGHLFELDAASSIQPIFRKRDRQTKPWRCVAIVGNAKGERSTGTNCRRSAMNTTCRLRRRLVRAVADRWIVSVRTSPASWNYNPRSWKPTSTSALNTPVAAARMACARRRCHRGRFPAASPDRGWLPKCWSASSATICRSTAWKTSWPARASTSPAARSVTG